MRQSLAICSLLAACSTPPAGASESLLQRAPYVQNVGASTVTILWRTAGAVAHTIEYGPSPREYPYSFTEVQQATAHEVTLSGLEPGTQYYYRIVEDGITLADGAALHFRTDPGRAQTDFQFFVTADVGVDSPSESHQYDTQAMIRSVSPPADLGLLAGDIVYPDGDSRDYDEYLMAPWAELLCNTPVWPALGNHDWQSNPEHNFVREWALPNNEHYYSFDFANAHFIALDTMNGSLFEEADQLAWLQQDLAGNTNATWTFVYFHHPLITCTYKGNENRLAAQLTPLFERYAVDIVFTGHAHTYERLYPSFQGTPLHQDQDPHYQDPSAPIYVVSGCGGKIKPAEPTSYCGPTAFYMDERILFTQVFVRGHALALFAIDSVNGGLVDAMSIVKNPNPTSVRVATPRSRLLANVPNPFNPATFIPFEIPATTHVRLDVYGADGRRITRLSDSAYPAGQHRVLWNGVDQRGQSVPSGVYVVRMRAAGRTVTRKVTLLR